MEVFLTYGQTPELRRLATKADRDSVHAVGWRRLRATQPRLWHRSFAIVIVCVAIGALAALVLNRWFLSVAPGTAAYWGGGLGGAVGVLLHIHMMATALRPIYAEIISARQEEHA